MGEAVAFAALAWISAHFSLALLLVVVTADGVLSLTARSLTRAATAAVTTPAGLLREGNALVNGAFSVSFFVGPAIGALVADAGSTQIALLLNTAMFALITVILASTRGLPPAFAQRTPTAGRLRAAIRLTRRHPPLHALLWLQATALTVFTISLPVEVVFAEHTLQSGRAGYAALLSAWGAGTVFGSAVYARWLSLPGPTMIALGAGSLGAGFLLMAVAPSLGVAIAGGAIAGAGNGIEAVAARTTLQEQVDAQWMAMVMSLNESLFQAMPGPGILLGGAITALAGTRAALATAGVGALLITLAAWTLLPARLAASGVPATPPGPSGSEPPAPVPAGSGPSAAAASGSGPPAPA
jgi:MFS family permease